MVSLDVAQLIEGTWSILDLRSRAHSSKGAMVGINPTTNKIVLYNWGRTDNAGQELNTRPWEEVLNLVGNNYDNWLSPAGNILLEPCTDSSKWPGQRSVYSPTVRHDVTTLLDAGVIELKSKVYLGNWARKDGRYIGTASDVVKGQETSQRASVTLYHGTDTLRLDSIQKEGIKPVSREQRAWKGEHASHRDTAVYLTPNEDQAQYYAAKAVRVDKYAIGLLKNRPVWGQWYNVEYTPWQLLLQKWAKGRHKPEPITLKVVIPSTGFGNLRADDDYLARHPEKHHTDWEASLHDFGQVAYVGVIPANWVAPVDLGAAAQVECLLREGKCPHLVWEKVVSHSSPYYMWKAADGVWYVRFDNDMERWAVLSDYEYWHNNMQKPHAWASTEEEGMELADGFHYAEWSAAYET